MLRAAGSTLPAGARAPALQDAPDAPVLFAEGVMDEISVWDGTARLTIHDARLASGGGDLATRALDDGRTSLEAGDLSALAEAERLRERLVAWRAGLTLATEPGTPVPEALRAGLRERGYWTPE